ncbi:hypothetical protein SBOR_7890 [Sclerotinia borealis F-4128]|uniref:Uncharacterized protein n=1 Tax=Sclerotinia borealis (strain F-4128) TaxID=1432307 RepID=W9CA51_SCLBF|nr:hypothetical protein SBOR_7890 [Sclerotinia borealis F-4128]
MLTLLIFTWVLCILPISVLGKSKKSAYIRRTSTDLTEDDGRESYKPISIVQDYEEGSTGQSPPINYTLPWPATTYIQPTVTSQGMTVTSVIPIYETCNLPGARTTTCSPSFQTIITTICSTVLIGYFTRHTVSECNEIVTFSTQYGYSLATTRPPASTVSALHRRKETTSITTNYYVHNTTTYYAAPWQSIAAGDPSDIQVNICGLSSAGVQVCTTINEVWVVHTEYIPVYYTEAISISTLVSSTGVLAFGPAIYVTMTPGTFMLSTQIVSTTLSARNVTSTSTVSSPTSEFADLASTTEGSTTTTIYISDPGSTTTIHLELASPSTSIKELTTRTTTITSTTKITSTTTLTPRRTVFRTI